MRADAAFTVAACNTATYNVEAELHTEFVIETDVATTAAILHWSE